MKTLLIIDATRALQWTLAGSSILFTAAFVYLMRITAKSYEFEEDPIEAPGK